MLLTRALRAEQDARLDVARGFGRHGTDAVAGFWAAEVARLREEMRALLAGTDSGEPSPGTVPPRS